MKGLKFAVAGAAAAGLLTMFIPIGEGPIKMSMFGVLSLMAAWKAYLIVGGFGVALVVAILGITKPPFKAPLAGAALGGFAAASFAGEIWNTLPHIGDAPGILKLFPIALVVGLIVSGLALAKPEE